MDNIKQPGEQVNTKPGAENETDLVRRITDRYASAQKAREPYETKWKRYHNLYRSTPPPRKDENRANLFIPLIFSTIETIMPRLVAGYLATTKPPLDVVGREPLDHENAEATRTLITYQMEQGHFPEFMDLFTKPALIYGTSIAKVYWHFDPPNHDGPRFDVVDLFDFFIDPDALSIEEARYVIQRKMMSMEELQQRGDIYQNIEQVTSGQGTDDNRNPIISDRGTDTQDRQEDKRDVELLEYWEDDRVIVLANRKTILRDEPNPFAHGKKPFISIVFVPVPGEFYGIGAVEPLEALQNELNTKRNQRLDNVNLIINTMWLMTPGAVDDINQLRTTPGGIIVANDINGLQPLPVQDVTSSAYQEEQLIQRDIHDTSGVSEFVRGNSVEGNKITATEIRLKAEQATTRLDYNLKLMAEKGLRELGRMIIQLDQQFIENETVVRVAGSDGAAFVLISPDEIQGNFDVQVNPDPAGLGEQERLQKAQMALDALQAAPGADPVPLVRDILEKLEISEKIIQATFLPIEQQRAALQLQLQQQQLSMIPPAEEAGAPGMVAPASSSPPPGIPMEMMPEGELPI